MYEYLESTILIIRTCSLYIGKDFSAKKRNIIYMIRLISFVLISYLLYTEYKYCTEREEFNLVDVVFTICLIMGSVLGLIREIYLTQYADEMDAIFEKVNKLFVYETTTGLNEKNMKEAEDFVAKISFSWAFSFLVPPLLFFSIRFILHPTELPIPAWVPYDLKNMRYFIPSVIIQIITAILIECCCITSEIFYFALLYVTGEQFKLLAWNIENVVYTAFLNCGLNKNDIEDMKKSLNIEGTMTKEIENKFYNVLDFTNTVQYKTNLYKQIYIYIRQHQKLLIFSEELNNFIAPLWSVIIITHVLFQAFSLFSLVLIQDDTVSLLMMVNFTFISLTNFFVTSIFGQYITDCSLEVNNALQRIPWYLVPDKTFGSILRIVTQRSLKPVIITAGHYLDIGFDLFISICKVSVSYFTLLRDLTDK